MLGAIDGLRLGHWTGARTGCTVILPPVGSTGSVFVPGAAPATRETDALRPGTLVDEVHAVLLTGGSAFGLAAADGVMRWLEERGLGFPTPAGPVPIVPAAAIYDLGVGRVRPGSSEGYAACEAAREDDASRGAVGAGTGATVGKRAGPDHAEPGGLGQAVAREGDLVVAALAVVNAFGDVVDADGSVIAGCREPEGPRAQPPGVATTLVCVATNAALDKVGCNEVAISAYDGLVSAVFPVTMFDGDAIFVLATRTVPSPADEVGRIAARVVADAIREGVRP